MTSDREDSARPRASKRRYQDSDRPRPRRPRRDEPEPLPIIGDRMMLAAAVACGMASVFLVEEVGERPYRIDRMWTQLRAAGVESV